MATLVSTLYPPVISTFLPAFINTEDATINFSISPFNEVNDIKRVHITCTNQSNNENALNSPSGIIMQPLGESNDGVYTVKIPVNGLKDGNNFNINQFYKVQIRFDSYDGTNIPADNDPGFLSYLLEYQPYFSEWSTVCLIKPILKPDIYLRSFDTTDSQETLTFHKGIISLSGKVVFDEDVNSVETETLQSYKVQVLDPYIDEVLYTSPTIFTGDNIDPNDINYKMDLQNANLGEGFEFRFRILATTKNQYNFYKDYSFKIANFIDIEGFNPQVSVNMNNESGIATLTIQNANSTDNLFGVLYVKRASSIDNFTNWESISTTKITGLLDKLVIEDNTVGCYIWYRYSIQFENSKGALTDVIRTPKFMPEFYDVTISRKKRQLSLRYDCKISNFKPVVNRSKIDTLGGRYPKFVENAILNYKQFSLSGTITAEEDFRELFLNKKEYYGDDWNNYQVYLAKNNVKNMVRNDTLALGDTENLEGYHVTTTIDDWFWEREFREEAIKWLNDGEPKLFRSMTEGIIPIMLTDVTLTPKAQLGRIIWDFSATAYEIADGHSLNSLAALGIIDIPTVDDDYLTSGGSGGGIAGDEFVEIIKLGQIYQEQVSAEKSNIVASVIGPRITEEYAGVLNTKVPTDYYLKSVKIYFHSQPNTFLQTANGLILINDPGNKNIYTDEQRERMILGYSFDVTTSGSIGSTKIFVNSKGYYQLPDNMDITEISFPQSSDIISMDYLVVYKEKPASGTIISGSSIQSTLVGQQSGVFKPGEYLGEKIRTKYNYIKTNEYYQQMQYWKGICVDVTPYAVVSIKYRGDITYNDYLVGATGVLHMQEDYPVIDMRFKGRRMVETTQDRQQYLEGWEYIKQPGKYNNINAIKPVLNNVYDIKGQLKIYYQYQWYDFQEQDKGVGLAIVPIEGMINYTGDIVRLSYN